MEAKKPLLIKLLLIGDSGVGKSCLLLRFTDNDFKDSYVTTIGIDFKIREVDIGGQKCKIQIWDTAGQERFRTITSAYYRGAHGIGLTYDVTCRDSFENISYWMKHMEKYAAADVCRIIIANKTDLVDKRVVQTSEGQQLAKQYNCDFYETSAMSGEGVQAAFMDFAKEIKHRRYDNPTAGEPAAEATDKKGVTLGRGSGSNEKKCCK
mmetsp:Transcript_110921/g.192259  ORF Transcript_110921/g.192259 Transcript_110921/m.192259 type:complete len:208 (-) Transcript_110921:136-759(-)